MTDMLYPVYNPVMNTQTEQTDLTEKLLKFGFPEIKNGRSVSTLVDSVKVEFDVEAKSKATAVSRGVLQQTVKDEWAAKGDVSRKLGMALHDYIAGTLRGYQPDPIESLSDKKPHMHQFDRFWERAGDYFSPVWVEQPVTSSYYRVNGRIDAMVHSSQTGLYHVIDWKTGTFDGQGWNQLKAPFEDLRDSSGVLGALQLGIYRLAIEHQVGYKIGDGYLVHLSSGSYSVRRVPDLRKRLDVWLLQGV